MKNESFGNQIICIHTHERELFVRKPNVHVLERETTVDSCRGRNTHAECHSSVVNSQVGKGQAVKQISGYEVNIAGVVRGQS